MFEEMISCPMRHKNGNCFSCGEICTAVNNEMCKALRTAYQIGYSDSCADSIRNGAQMEQEVQNERIYSDG